MRYYRPGRQGKAVPAAYGALAFLLLVVIAAVALVVQPAAPPALAEYAPQAVDRIDDAPADQSSAFGTGDGGCAAGQACGGPRPEDKPATRTGDDYEERPPVDKARVRRCIGDPPRQIEDPQSPPCVNYFEGDNGGATARGVTRDEIRVAVAGVSRQTELLAEFFNRRFEFFGRRIRLVPFEGGAGGTPDEQRAAAQSVEDAGAFAALDPGIAVSDVRPFFTELSRRGIVAIAEQTPMAGADLARHRPFLWQYGPAIDVAQQEFVHFACASLVGSRAEHAGPSEASKTRKFGVIYAEQDGAVDTSPLREGLQACGAGAVPVTGVDGENSTSISAGLDSLRNDGVTSLLCPCSSRYHYNISSTADSNAYFPEWLLAGDLRLENANYLASNVTPEQRRRTFGLAADNRHNRIEDEPAFWALKEVDPTFVPWEQDRYSSIGGIYHTYHALLLLASGIQTAGPTLTPATFERGLLRTRFPNAGAGAAPYWQASVGFRAGDYSMTDDFALLYWSENADPDGGKTGTGYAYKGGFCYIDRGARWSGNTWPRGRRPFFDPGQPCR